MPPNEAASTNNTLKQQVTYPIARLNAEMTAQAARLLRKRSDLSLSQWRLMASLDSMGAASITDVIKFTNSDKGQMSRVVKDLLANGKAISTPSTVDQRVNILSMTDTGRAAYNRAEPHMRARREYLLSALTKTEQAQFFHLIEKLRVATERFEDQI